MPRCHGQDCQVSAGFNVKGSKTGKYCKQHAEDGMVNVVIRRCFYASCAKAPAF
ncbi:unnamed protein product, partial [Scytosiphon promiscuus]